MGGGCAGARGVEFVLSVEEINISWFNDIRSSPNTFNNAQFQTPMLTGLFFVPYTTTHSCGRQLRRRRTVNTGEEEEEEEMMMMMMMMMMIKLWRKKRRARRRRSFRRRLQSLLLHNSLESNRKRFCMGKLF